MCLNEVVSKFWESRFVAPASERIRHPRRSLRVTWAISWFLKSRGNVKYLTFISDLVERKFVSQSVIFPSNSCSCAVVTDRWSFRKIISHFIIRFLLGKSLSLRWLHESCDICSSMHEGLRVSSSLRRTRTVRKIDIIHGVSNIAKYNGKVSWD